MKKSLSLIFATAAVGMGALFMPDEALAIGIPPAVQVTIYSAAAGDNTSLYQQQKELKELAVTNPNMANDDLMSLGIRGTQAKHIDTCRDKFNILPNLEKDPVRHRLGQHVLRCLSKEEKIAQLTASNMEQAKVEGASDMRSEFIFMCREELAISQEEIHARKPHTLKDVSECIKDKVSVERFKTTGKIALLVGLPLLGFGAYKRLNKKNIHNRW